MSMVEMPYPLIKSLTALDSANHNDTVNIEGYLHKYTPEAVIKGKGGGAQFFDYMILFADNTKIPVRKEVKLDTNHIGDYVNLLCVVVRSPIHSQPCPPYCQNTSEFWQIQNIIHINTLPYKD